MVTFLPGAETLPSRLGRQFADTKHEGKNLRGMNSMATDRAFIYRL